MLGFWHGYDELSTVLVSRYQPILLCILWHGFWMLTARPRADQGSELAKRRLQQHYVQRLFPKGCPREEIETIQIQTESHRVRETLLRQLFLEGFWRDVSSETRIRQLFLEGFWSENAETSSKMQKDECALLVGAMSFWECVRLKGNSAFLCSEEGA